MTKRMTPLYYTSLVLFIILVADCFVDPPRGLKWFRSLFGIPEHGPENSKCQLDDEGSWQIGLSSGSNPPWEWGNDNIDTKSPIISCSSLSQDNSASYVSDPFLFPVEDDKWYLFFTYKNAKRMAGEIGVSVSNDKGVTWKFLGSALKDQTNDYSFPFVHRDEHNPQIYRMIPSLKNVENLFVYETSQEEFPFGWKLKNIPLTGAAFTNTAVVWHENRYWIYTSKINKSNRKDSASLHLYHAHDLLDPWHEHSMSPLTTSDKLLGYSGGRPFVYNGNIYRFDQDKRKTNGEGINILRVNVLTLDEYYEQPIKYIQPDKYNQWSKARLRHFDVNLFDKNTWVVSFAADQHVQKNRNLELEWMFHCGKRLLMALLFLHLLYLKSNFFFHITSQFFPKMNFSEMKSILSERAIQILSLSFFPLSRNKKHLRDHMMYHSLWILIAILLAILSTDMMEKCPEHGSFDTEKCFDWKKNTLMTPANNFSGTIPKKSISKKKSLFKGTVVDSVHVGINNFTEDDQFSGSNDTNELFKGADDDSLVIVTACSSTYFERLKNFIGSIHYWEPNLEVLIYDIGLSESHLIEMSQWKRVEVVRFDFKKYPVHVSLLYNFAWKILLFDEVSKKYPKFMYLDSGVEIRHPLIGLRYFLEKDGHYSTQLEDGRHTIGPSTNPKTYAKLKELGVEFDEEEIRKQPFCAGGIQGFINGKESTILQIAVSCALDEDCISPKGSGRDHNYDQSVLSVLYYSQGLGHCCDHKDIFADSDETVYTLDETRCNYVEMGARRWRIHRPYTKYIDRYIESQPIIEYFDQDFLVERTQGTSIKVGAKSNWRQCKEKCRKTGGRNEVEKCFAKCKKNREKKKTDFFLMIAYAKFDRLLTLFWKCVMCKVIRLKILFVYLFISIIISMMKATKRGMKVSALHQD